MMFCQACGHQMHQQAASCPSCGKPNALLAQTMDGPAGWFSFRGRISRKVFWLHYFLPITAIGMVAQALDAAVHGRGILSGLISLAVLVPQFASCVKRLHDRNRSGWMTLVGLIPIVGWIWLFVDAGCLRGTFGPNRYGADRTGDILIPAMRPAAPF